GQWRGAGWGHGGEGAVGAHGLAQDLGRVLDLPATGAGQVAAEQRLEHEDERIAPPAAQLLPDHVGADRPHLRQRNAHMRCIPPPPSSDGPSRPRRAPPRGAIARWRDATRTPQTNRKPPRWTSNPPRTSRASPTPHVR